MKPLKSDPNDPTVRRLKDGALFVNDFDANYSSWPDSTFFRVENRRQAWWSLRRRWVRTGEVWEDPKDSEFEWISQRAETRRNK